MSTFGPKRSLLGTRKCGIDVFDHLGAAAAETTGASPLEVRC